MRLRTAPLRAAIALALGFVAVRVIYRVLFHGADGAGAVVLPLPVWRLPAPFQHVEILGPATTGGLWDAAVSAVPVALVIVVFGALNAVFDVPRLIVRGAGRGPLQGIARALSVAWATLPALVDAVRTTRFAWKLRGERAGVRILAPALEQTLERATAVAAALEIRGYAGRQLDSGNTQPVCAHAMSAGFGLTTTLAADSVELRTGTLTVLTGPTGAGKSTLLRTLSGLHSHIDGGWLRGAVSVVGHERAALPPRDLSRHIGVVLQNPRQGFATSHVREEIGLSLELRGERADRRMPQVEAVASQLGITELLDRELRNLSAGEATLVAIAAAIVQMPLLLLVDEPLADLDVAARTRIIATLDDLAHNRGICVLVAEHRAGEFAPVADSWLRVTEGTVEESRGGAEISSLPAFAALREQRPDDALSARGAALRVTELSVRHGSRVAVQDASLSLSPGEVTALRGPNGAGKSSLLVALATGDDASRVALVPDDSDALFVRDTVAAECRRVDRRWRAPAGETARRFGALLNMNEGDPAWEERLRRHPRDLSVGERRCLAIMVQTAAGRPVLLLDEPTRGLDPRARALVAAAVRAQAAEGTAVLFATHDAEFAAAVADHHLEMHSARLRPAAPFSGPLVAPHTPALRLAERTLPPTDQPTQRPLPHDLAEDCLPPQLNAPAGGTLPPLIECRAEGTAYRDHSPRRPQHRPRPAALLSLIAAHLTALAAFAWPLVALATPAQAQAAVPYIALALAPLAIVVALATLDASVRSAHTLALLATLAAIGAAIRIASTGVGGVEALFVLLILAGRAFGPRFGLLLGASSLALSAMMWGGVGPWLPFQMFACGWVGAGAGLLPRRVRGAAEIVMLCAYGVVASYAFGLVMNMWFWPFAVGSGTSISYVPGGAIGENLSHFLVYSLLTSTAGWDTLRAVTTVVGVSLIGRAVLRSLRRAKPVAATTAVPPGAQPRTTVRA